MKILLLVIVLGFQLCAYAQQAVDTTEAVSINGIQQFISLKGKDRSNPLLLFLHGGPGNSVMSYAHKFTSRLESNFVVVMWDQRASGKTQDLNHSDVPLTLSLFERDTYELIGLLLKKFHQQKLYLVGHSWGTVLGFEIASRYPELLHAYVAISPVINQLESERIILDIMKEKAAREKKQEAMEELSKVSIPFENGDQIYFHRKWLADFNGQRKLQKQFVLTWADTWLPVWNEATAINRFKSLPSINCPVYFLTGTKDYQTNYSITEDYFNTVTAPVKQLFKFDNAGHSLPATRGNQIQDIFLREILPATLPGFKIATH
jgi:pimeloyl-ACP methyl ester carboxylesterase